MCNGKDQQTKVAAASVTTNDDDKKCKLNGEKTVAPPNIDSKADALTATRIATTANEAGDDLADNENKAASDNAAADKKKLVVRLSLGKSIEDEANDKLEQMNQSNATEPLIGSSQMNIDSINKHLTNSVAFKKFIESSLYRSPSNPEVIETLRAADKQRLSNTHESKENTPEPGNVFLCVSVLSW